MKQKIFLGSDNCSPAHPAIIEAIIEANNGYASSYGSDPWTKSAEQVIQKALKREAQVFMVPTGTGANVFSLKIACKRHESVLCSDIGHLNFQESGAPEAIVGCKVLGVPQINGKMSIEALGLVLKRERAFGKHATSPRVVSITQSTEVGTVYSLAEMKEISDFCKENDLLLHIDGSRIYNAAVSLAVGLDEMMSQASCDILSLGGTKNGLMGAEAVVIFNQKLWEGCFHLHKQTLQLLSKMRFLSAQYLAFFNDDLWQKLALNANLRAQEIAAILKNVPGISLNYPVETNQIFISANEEWFKKIPQSIDCIPWDEKKQEIRLIASWSTSKEDVENLRKVFENPCHSERGTI